MGNASSNYVNVALNPPNPSVSIGASTYYIAGTKVNGTVYITAPEGAQEADIKLKVYFTGKEDVCVQYHETQYYTDSQGHRQSRQVSRHAYAKRDICRMFIDVTGSPASKMNNFQKGNYAFPFSFQLPNSLPTSMHHTGDGGRCSIVYKVKAELEGKWRTKSNEVQLLIVATPPDSAPVPNLVNPTTERIKTCCCFDRGSITFGASLDDTRIGNGEEIKIDMGCKNESASEITSVKAEIFEYVSWNAGAHTNRTNRIIAVKEFQKTDLMAKKEKNEMQIIRMNEKNGVRSRGGSDALYREIYEMLNDGKNATILPVPWTIHHDYAGLCIHVTHMVTLTIKTPCCSGNPSRSVLLNVVSPKIVEQALHNGNIGLLPSAPALEPVSVAVPSAPLLPTGWDAGTTYTAPVASSTSNNTILGGYATNSDQEIHFDTFSPIMNGPTGISLNTLVFEMQSSINPKTTVSDKTNDIAWHKFFSDLSPIDYCTIIKTVTSEFDQPDVALVVAENIQNFSSNHIVAMLRVVSEPMRITSLQKTLPLCNDIVVNKGKILAELSDWERICTEYDFSKLR